MARVLKQEERTLLTGVPITVHLWVSKSEQKLMLAHTSQDREPE